MKKSILLAVAGTDIEQVRVSVELAIDLMLVAHEGDYRGGVYYRGQSSEVALILQENFIEDDGEPTEAEFPEEKLLVYVDGGDTGADNVVAKLVAGQAAKVLRYSTY